MSRVDSYIDAFVPDTASVDVYKPSNHTVVRISGTFNMFMSLKMLQKLHDVLGAYIDSQRTEDVVETAHPPINIPTIETTGSFSKGKPILPGWEK